MIKGIIFDMDGVISDTQKLHSKVEANLLNRFGVDISPEEITAKYSGVRTKDFFKELLSDKKGIDLDSIMKEKWIKMEQLASESVEAIAGSLELIERLFSEKYPLAVASASNFNYVNQVLVSLEINHKFKAIVSGDMVRKGKPDPEIFLLAAEKINVKPARCLVVEDGRSGMMAARSAGMKCIGLVKNLDSDYPTKNKVTSLTEISLQFINQI